MVEGGLKGYGEFLINIRLYTYFWTLDITFHFAL